MPFISFSLPIAMATILCQVRVLRIQMASLFLLPLTVSVFYSLTNFFCAFVYVWLYLCACGDERSTLSVIPCF